MTGMGSKPAFLEKLKIISFLLRIPWLPVQIPGAGSPALFSQCAIHSAAPNVNDARKALREQACPGIGCLRVAPRLL